MRKIIWSLLLVLIMTLIFSTVALAVDIPQGDWVIGLSNSYYGNTWRKQMVDSFERAAENAKEKGYIKDYKIVNGDNTVNQQVSQMNSLILEGVDAICINSASPNALNDVIEKAHERGIKVVAFDSIATSDYAYKLDFNFTKAWAKATEYVVDRLNGEGNVIVIKGVSGSAPSQAMYEGHMKVLDEYPDIKVVNEFHGEASATETQNKLSTVLPNLPEVDAVLTQGGGDAWGAVQAFQGTDRSMPIIVGDNTGEFIDWWINKKEEGYETVSLGSTPGIGSAAFWEAVFILNGRDVPDYMVFPALWIRQDEVEEYDHVEHGRILSPSFSADYVWENLILPNQ